LSKEHCKGNKTVPKTLAKTRTEDGHRQSTKTSAAIQSERKKEHRTTEEEMEGQISSGGSRNRLTHLNLHEHDVDDYMFRALLAHPQKVLHKRRLVYCVRVMSIGCYQGWSGTEFHSNPGYGTY
jgi:hypothetical protein